MLSEWPQEKIGDNPSVAPPNTHTHPVTAPATLAIHTHFPVKYLIENTDYRNSSQFIP